MNPLRPLLAFLAAVAATVGATLTELLAWLLEPAHTHPPRAYYADVMGAPWAY